MFNIINKSVKSLNSGISSIVSGITGENSYKTEVDFCKFDTINLNFLKNSEKETHINSDQYYTEYNVFYLVYSKVHLNIYLITEDLELKCIFCQKMNFIIVS